MCFVLLNAISSGNTSFTTPYGQAGCMWRAKPYMNLREMFATCIKRGMSRSQPSRWFVSSSWPFGSKLAVILDATSIVGYKQLLLHV